MPMYNLIEYSDNYSKTSESLWQNYKDKPNDILAKHSNLNCFSITSSDTNMNTK